MKEAHSKTLKVIKEYESLCNTVLKACNENSDTEEIISDSINYGLDLLEIPIVGIPLAGLSIIDEFVTAGIGIKDLSEYFRNKALQKKAWKAIEESFKKIRKNSIKIIPEGKKTLKTYVLDKIYAHFIKNDLKSYLIQNYEEKMLCTENLKKAIILQFSTYKNIALGESILTLSNNYEDKLYTDLKDFQTWIRKTIKVDVIKCYTKAKEDVYNLLILDCDKKDKEKIDYIFTLLNGLVPIDFDFNHKNDFRNEIEETLRLELLGTLDSSKNRKFPDFYYTNSNFKNLICSLTKIYNDSVQQEHHDDNFVMFVFCPILFTVGAIITGLILRLIFKTWLFSIILTVGTIVFSYVFGIIMAKKRNKAHVMNPFSTIKTFWKKNIYSKLKTIKKRILKEELKKVSNEDFYSLSLIVEDKIKKDEGPSVSLSSDITPTISPKINDITPSSSISTINEDEVFGALEDFVNSID